MSTFHYRYGDLYCEGLDTRALAERFGTPLYVYSASAIESSFDRLRSAFAELNPRLHYAVKANGNLSILRLLIARGASMDVVSGGELERALHAGARPDGIVYAGVGKTEDEIRSALGRVGLFNVESEQELERIAALARERRTCAEVCLRVNPDVDAHTHKYTTTGKKENKFGISLETSERLFRSFHRHEHVRIVGIHMHLGSPIASPRPYEEAIGIALSLTDRLGADGIELNTLNIGGGYGVDYGAGEPATPEQFAAVIVPLLRDRVAKGLRVLLEPGRYIVANAGVLLTRVQYVKEGRQKTFVVCDAGMQTLLRPALYEAYHFVWPAKVAEADVPPRLPGSPASSDKARSSAEAGVARMQTIDVVGPVCESSDFLAQSRELPDVRQGDLLCIFSAGAYGMSMASTYNDHPRPAEVIVRGQQATLIRRRQSIESLLMDEIDCESP